MIQQQPRHNNPYLTFLGRGSLFTLCNGERVYFKPTGFVIDPEGRHILIGLDIEGAVIKIVTSSIVTAAKHG